ncbi:MAG: SIS domain-containing protein [Cytophagales bacterium]|nr:SIS domain-containing protein [Cytophagales bacterium]
MHYTISNLIGAAFIKETENAIEYLDRGEKAIQSEAELIARKLKGKLPVIYCDERLKAMALRFQNQINENAKQLAHVNTFPEMNHNEIVGWQFPEAVLQQAQVILFCTPITIMNELKNAWRFVDQFLKKIESYY